MKQLLMDCEISAMPSSAKKPITGRNTFVSDARSNLDTLMQNTNNVAPSNNNRE